jgi:tRNA pseudouridine38-40 synthase
MTSFLRKQFMKKEKKKYKLTISYDGTQYSGWQVQTEKVLSIQSLIQKALELLLREKISLIGSGRTDAGVHALAQVAHFSTSSSFEDRKLLHSLNSILPKDIRIEKIESVDSHFHARYSALGKTYHYHLHLGPTLNPFQRLYALHIRYPLDIPLLKQAAKCFLGTHDFSSFANDAKRGSAAKNAIRTLYRLDIFQEKDSLRMEFEGTGFLYKMVRNIVGTLLEIARGKMKLEDLPHLFFSKDRRQAPQAAPALGLFLVKVNYSKKENISTKDG